MKDPNIRRVLVEIAAGTLTRAAAALQLECSPRHINRLMQEHGIHRPPGQSRVKRAAARAARSKRVEKIQLCVGLVKEEKIDVSVAADRAGCSERTIYRYMAKGPFKK